MLACASAFAEDPVRIGTIRVESVDVFSPEEAAKGWIYRAANAIHMQTRESFLRKQLLFREGDVLDIAQLEETERNLRALPFIKIASVTASVPQGGVSDVLVRTQDSWTTQPGGSFGSKGGRTAYSVEFQEVDVLGTGRSISFAYDHGTERTTRSIEYSDPYLFRPFWRGRLLYADNSDGRQRVLEVKRPFYSFLALWSADGLLVRDVRNEKMYADGEVDAEFQHDRRERLLSYGRAIAASEAEAQRVTVGYDAVDDDFSPVVGRPNAYLPDRRSFRYVFTTFESVGNSFVTMNFVNRDSRDEDFNLAPRLFVRAAVSPRALGAPSTSAFAELAASGGALLREESFGEAAIDVQSRFDDGTRNTMVSVFLGYVKKLPTERLQTFVGRLQFDRGWHLDRDVQFAADGATGLRGYRLHAFTGDKRVILNLEDRFFFEREYLQLFSPGAVAFVDTGMAEPEGRPLRLGDLKTDVGVGLRIAIGRAASNNILRFDCAYALNRDPMGRRGFLVSFSSSQAFSFGLESRSGQ
jgi:hypothetical protein